MIDLRSWHFLEFSISVVELSIRNKAMSRKRASNYGLMDCV